VGEHGPPLIKRASPYRHPGGIARAVRNPEPFRGRAVWCFVHGEVVTLNAGGECSGPRTMPPKKSRSLHFGRDDKIVGPGLRTGRVLFSVWNFHHPSVLIYKQIIKTGFKRGEPLRKLALATVLVLAVAVTAAAGEKYGQHTIRGMNYDKAAVEKLLDDSEVPAEVTADERGVKELKGKFRLDQSMPVEDAVLDFIDRHRNAFMLKDPKKELKRNSKEGLRYQQIYNGVPVWGHSLSVHLNQDYDVTLIMSGLIPTPDIDARPLVTKEEALEIASRDRQSVQHGRISNTITKLCIYNEYKGPRLVYFVTFLQNLHSWIYFIDARTGEITEKFSNDMYDD
jgi:Peptidase propeptide and YPEB domain/Fungalysin/Thermolysin Propeptide Motif